MTDKEIADKVYIEPLTCKVLEQIIAKERPDSVLPTLGGQAGLNLGMELAEAGIFEKYNTKEKDNKNDMNEANKLIHYFLPADICTGCPNVSKIYEEHGYPATQKEIEEAFYNNKNAKKTKSEEDYEE